MFLVYQCLIVYHEFDCIADCVSVEENYGNDNNDDNADINGLSRSF